MENIMNSKQKSLDLKKKKEKKKSYDSADNLFLHP